MIGQIYGTGTGITAIPESPEVVATSEERTFWSEVDRFKAKADEAITLWQSLRAKRLAAQSDPRLKAEYDQVMDEAEDITGKVSDVERWAAEAKQGIAEKIVSWLPGLDGIDVMRAGARGLGALGLSPLVVLIPLVAAAVAWLGTWISKAYIVDRKLTAVENLNAQGVPISEAGAIIAEKGDPGALAIFAGKAGTGVALAALVAVGLFFFLPRGR